MRVRPRSTGHGSARWPPLSVKLPCWWEKKGDRDAQRHRGWTIGNGGQWQVKDCKRAANLRKLARFQNRILHFTGKRHVNVFRFTSPKLLHAPSDQTSKQGVKRNNNTGSWGIKLDTQYKLHYMPPQHLRNIFICRPHFTISCVPLSVATAIIIQFIMSVIIATIIMVIINNMPLSLHAILLLLMLLLLL